MIVLKSGERITPYEQRLRGWSLTMNLLPKVVYGGVPIKDLIYNENPFLKTIPK
jgi:hypothetical protein